MAIALFLWYRKRLSSKLKETSDLPVPAEDVLNRPDPIEKSLTAATELSTVKVYSKASSTTSDLNLESPATTIPFTTTQLLSHPNPFDDNHSIQTTGTDGTNVIPIAFVPPESTSQTDTLQGPPGSPVRPARAPDLNLNLEHVNVSRDSLRATSPNTQASATSARHSYMSGASYSSDFLNEAPMIITPTKGTIRQVLGVVKAEVIKTPSAPPTPVRSDNLKPPRVSRPPVGSPLAMASFGPADMMRDSMYEQDITVPGNPFSDEHSPQPSSGIFSASPATGTFGNLSRTQHESTGSDWVPENPRMPWAKQDSSSRPSSLSTQAGSIIDIGNATRVNVGLSPNSAGLNPRSPYRTTMGRLVSPPTNGVVSTLEEQQQRALAHAQARAQAQGLDMSRRVSGSSTLSATSTRADSILESFPFVPPSPISDRPIRSPPCSPLVDQTFGNRGPAKESPLHEHAENDFLHPPDRRTLGLSTASQLSTSSAGLGSFPFQIEAAPGHDMPNPPTSLQVRHRASLDTLALTSDLSSYPLGFDHDARDLSPGFQLKKN